MKMAVTWMSVGLAAMVMLGASLSASAEEGGVKAIAPWKGQGYAFPIGNDRVYMVAVFSGTIFVDDGKGPLHAGSIVCPATMEGDLNTMTKTGQGHCILTNEDGDRVFAHFTCTGDPEGCRGPFTLDGGTGRFEGITGEGEMVSQIQTRTITTVVGYESARQVTEGIAVWPKLSYRIPSDQ
jgi:hypothetical protein